jgi:hypothetical protein
VKYLDNVPETEITELNIPTAIPLVYELDADLKPIKHYYLADEVLLSFFRSLCLRLPASSLPVLVQETVRNAIAGVAAQGKAK